MASSGEDAVGGPARVGRRRLPLRLRLALFTAGLLLAASLGVVIALNVAVASSAGTIARAAPVETGTSSNPVGPSPPRRSGTEPAVLAVLRHVRIGSLLALAGVALVGGAATYWAAGRALRPVREVARSAARISAERLDTRLDVRGPDDELRELGDSFDAMLDRLERAFRSERRFVQDAAHELRTPLATLRTNLEVTLGDPSATVADCRSMGATLERSLQRLEALVEDLLTLASVEAPAPEAVVPTHHVIASVLGELGPFAAEHRVALLAEPEGAPAVLGSPALVQRALRNLLESAIRYNRPGGEVRLRCRSEPPFVAIEVEDTGAGIPPDAQNRVFERFYRVDDSRSRDRGGAGLGLAIAREAIERQGGAIELRSRLGVGTVVTVRLPAASAATTRSMPAPIGAGA